MIYSPSHAELPARLPPRRLFVVGATKHPKWAVFACPCGRGHQIKLNLDRARRPVWHLDVDPTASLRPSVDAFAIDRCHFWLRDGRVRWVEEGRTPPA